MNTDDIVKIHEDSWEKGRKAFSVSTDEMVIFLKSPAGVICHNKSNGDGTLHTSVYYKGRVFSCSHTERIEQT
jgi:hypothetical protein